LNYAGWTGSYFYYLKKNHDAGAGWIGCGGWIGY
jgi:hypothetical protein